MRTCGATGEWSVLNRADGKTWAWDDDPSNINPAGFGKETEVYIERDIYTAREKRERESGELVRRDEQRGRGARLMRGAVAVFADAASLLGDVCLRCR